MKKILPVLALALPLLSVLGNGLHLDIKLIEAPWLKDYPEVEEEVARIIELQKKEVTKYAEEYPPEFGPYSFHVSELKLFSSNNSDIVSVRMITYAYTGGAHGMRNYYSWNWSQKEQKFLSLEEVISLEEQFTRLIEETRKAVLESQENIDLGWLESGTSKITDFKIWNFYQERLVFIFPEYQIAPYSSGATEVSVPLSFL